MVPLLLLLSLSIFFFLLFLKKQNGRLPPGPEGLPIIGNLHQIDDANRPMYLWQLSQKYGPIFSLRLGFRLAVVVNSAKWAEEIMKTQDLDFCNRPFFTGQQTLSYMGKDLAFALYSSYWREMRKVCVINLFCTTRVQSFRPIREDEVHHLLDKLSKSADGSKTMDLTEDLMNFTSTLICRIAFGKRYEPGALEQRRFEQLLFGSFFFRDHFPLMSWVDKLTGLTSRLLKVYRELDDFYQELIDEALNNPNKVESQHEHILDILIRMWKDPSSNVKLSIENVKAILMNIFVAGTETSAIAVIWAISFLMKSPESMKKAQQEVRTIAGNKGFVDEDDLPKFNYIKAVVKETLRLQPTIPSLLPREASRKLKLGKYELPAKTICFINAWAVGRDPEAWEKPFEFNPNRFLGTSVDVKGQNFQLIPFGAGRRACPGLIYGLITVELLLSNLLYKFDWEMPEGKTVEDIDNENLLPGLAQHKRQHLCLVAKKYV